MDRDASCHIEIFTLVGSVTIHRSDNAHTGWFWSRPDAEVWKGAQPPVAVPGPDDWR